jgi:hypothetical protein
MLSGVVSAGVAADTVTTLMVAERTEGRMRFTHPVLPNEPASPAFDFDTTPSLRLQSSGAHWDGTVGGAYTFTEANIGQTAVGPERADFQSSLSLGSGLAAVGWHSKRVSIRLEEDGTYGDVNLAYLAAQQTIPAVPGTPPPPQATTLPRYIPAIITIFTSRSSLTATGIIDQAWSFGLAGSYAIGGGADFRSRNVSEGGQAVDRTPSGFASLTYRYGRRDNGILTVGVRHTDSVLAADPVVSVPGSTTMPTRTQILPTISGPGPTSDALEASASWHHTVSREVNSLLNLGVSFLREKSVGPASVAAVGRIPDTGWRPVPTGQAVLTERFGNRSLRGTATEGLYVLPALDAITGAVTLPVTAIADLRLTETTRVYLAEAGVTRTTPVFGGNQAAAGGTALQAFTGVQVGASVVQALGKRFDVTGGVRLLWQFTDAQTLAGGQQIPGQELDTQVVFVSFTYHELPIRL